jgi:hypothetical protein
VALVISPAAITVSVVPGNLGLTPAQQGSLSATTGDLAGVTWTVNPASGSFSAVTSQSGANVTFTAPGIAGIYTVTATSVTDGSKAASATVGVTDLAGVYTYHNDLARSGANSQEYVLTPANVTVGSFGKLFSCAVDGAIFAQPLWVPNLSINGAKHNVVFVATEHDSIFAFDADHSPCQQLWKVSLLDSAHGASAGETTVLSGGPNALVGQGYGGMAPEAGITGTPVIDPATGILYVVSKSVDSLGDHFYQRVHAIDLATGAEKSGSPATIAATYPGSGDGGSMVSFNPSTEFQRAGLAFVNGAVVIVWASHEDAGAYYGWIIGYQYDGKSLAQTHVLNVTPNVAHGGIWMAGAAPAADDEGNLYLITGNGAFDANSLGPLPANDYGDSLLQLSSQLAISQYFTPSDEQLGMLQDSDFGTSGAALINLPAGSPVTHLVVGGGKDGLVRVLNRDALGGYGDVHVWQQLSAGGGFPIPAFWNNYLFVSAGPLLTYQLDLSTAQFAAAGSTALIESVEQTRPMVPSVSANHASNGIVWTIESAGFCSIGASSSNPGSPAILAAYDATNVANELWRSSTVDADAAGGAVRFSAPTIANGKVYIGTRGSGSAACSLTSTTGELDVYGLK